MINAFAAGNYFAYIKPEKQSPPLEGTLGHQENPVKICWYFPAIFPRPIQSALRWDNPRGAQVAAEEDAAAVCPHQSAVQPGRQRWVPVDATGPGQ